MNRRGFVGAVAAIFGVTVIPTDSRASYEATKAKADRDAKILEDKYWDAQRHINALEDERITELKPIYYFGDDPNMGWGRDDMLSLRVGGVKKLT